MCFPGESPLWASGNVLSCPPVHESGDYIIHFRNIHLYEGGFHKTSTTNETWKNIGWLKFCEVNKTTKDVLTFFLKTEMINMNNGNEILRTWICFISCH